MSFSMIVTAYDASIMFQLSICHFCLLWQRFSNMTRKCSWSRLQLPPLPMDCATVMFCSFSSRISNWDFLFASYSIVKPCFSLIIPQCPGSSSLLTTGELAFFFFLFHVTPTTLYILVAILCLQYYQKNSFSFVLVFSCCLCCIRCSSFPANQLFCCWYTCPSYYSFHIYIMGHHINLVFSRCQLSFAKH